MIELNDRIDHRKREDIWALQYGIDQAAFIDWTKHRHDSDTASHTASLIFPLQRYDNHTGMQVASYRSVKKQGRLKHTKIKIEYLHGTVLQLQKESKERPL